MMLLAGTSCFKHPKNNKKSTTHYKLKITKNNTVHDIFYYRICVFVYVLTPSNNNNNSVISLVEFSCLMPKKLDLYLFIYCHIFVTFDRIFKVRGFKGNLIEVPFGNLFSFLCRAQHPAGHTEVQISNMKNSKQIVVQWYYVLSFFLRLRKFSKFWIVSYICRAHKVYWHFKKYQWR